MRIPFVKMHGLGNDFVLLDERERVFDLTPETLAALADRRLGIGCDQVLSLRPGRADAAAAYRVYNADGSAAEHCGNGIRCVALYLARRGEISGDRVNIEIGDELFELRLDPDGRITVDMGRPRFAPSQVPLEEAHEQDRYRLELGETSVEFGAVSMGNPHAVIAVDDAASARVGELGPAVQASGRFPEGVNVGFAEFVDRTHVRLRVYERGAGETRACGTGACAAVAIGRRWGLLDQDVIVGLRGGELGVSWSGDATGRVRMTGPAKFVFEGTIDL